MNQKQQPLMTGRPNDWLDAHFVEGYENIVKSDIVSDGVPYEVIGNMVYIEATEGRVLDAGSATGVNTNFLKTASGATEIVGWDIVEANVEKARAAYGDVEGLSFVYSPADQELPEEIGTFKAVTLSFVVPTIQNPADLQFLFNKLSKVIEPGGVLIMLCLNPESLTSGGNYISYQHRLPDGVTEPVDGQPFHNKLLSKDGGEIEFDDTIWTAPILYKMLKNAGFSNITPTNLSTTSNGGVMGRQIRSAIKNVSATEQVEWADEFTPGKELYQIWKAYMPGTLELRAIEVNEEHELHGEPSLEA